MEESRSFGMSKRKKIITRYVIFIAIVFFIALILLIMSTKSDKQEVIVYTENSNIDYNVYLKENEFFEERYLGKDNQYIASLIEYIQANFEYQLECSQPNMDFEYIYKIVAEVDVLDGGTKNPLYEFEEELIKEQKHTANTSRQFKINEIINIDYNKYNDLITKFVEMYDLEKIDTTLTVNMYVKVLDDFEKQDGAETPAITLSVPLTKNTMAIDIESNAVNQNDINVYKTMYNSEYMFGAIILMVAGFITIMKLKTFIKDMQAVLQLLAIFV